MKKVDLNKVVEQYKELSSQITILEMQKDTLADHIKMALGETEELYVGSHVVRFKTIVSSRFDTSTFKKVHAGLYTNFLKESTSRRFTVAESQ
jgi:predicted phage-related endonuclease